MKPLQNGPSLRPGGSMGPHGHLRNPKEKAKNIHKTLLKLGGYLKDQKSGLFWVCIMVFFTTGFNIAGPYLMKMAIDRHIIGGVNAPALVKLLILIGAFHFSAAGLTLLQRWMMIGVAQKAINRLRKDVFSHFQKLTIRFFDTHSTGELMSRLTNDIDNISNTVSNGVLDILSSLLSILTVGIVMLAMNWQLGLICLGVIPLIVFSTKKIAGHTRTGFRARQKHLGNLNGLIEESIGGHGVVKGFTKEEELLKIFTKENLEMKKASNKANITSGIMGPLMNMMNNLNYGITAFAGGVLSIYGFVSVGTIAAFLSYSRQFSRPLNQVAQLYTTIQSAIAGAERVFTLLEEKPEFIDPSDALPLKKVLGRVEIRDLHFNYQEKIPVLKGIDIKAEPGQTIALVGPTGAGKTTLINLLTRFYDYHQGAIYIDGRDIRQIRKADLRRSLGIVLQETFLFSGTVKENIRYGRLDASDEEIVAASKLANAHQFIHRMSQGYNTEISENGANLSEGQRQLIAIARAILSEPAILILDEATSSVDTRTEIHIQEGMLRLMEGRTSFVIAHRLSTIKNADAILVMKDGRIIERGTHPQLISYRGFYYRLYYSQFGEEARKTGS